MSMAALATNGADGQDQPWGKLISFSKDLDNVTLAKNAYSFGRNPAVDIKISDIKLSGQHCKISKDNEGNYWIEDLSSNGTFIDDELIGKGKKRKLVSGDKIYLLHQSKVKATEVLGYVFTALVNDSNELKRKREEDLKLLEDEKKISQKQTKFQEDLGEEMMCCICIDYIYQCVTAIPCLHNFCASCFSDWMEKSKMCPQCREEIAEVKKNATVNNIIGKFMENNPSKKRPKEEYEEMDKKNKIKQDKLVLKAQTTASIARPATGIMAPVATNNTNIFTNNTINRNTGSNARNGTNNSNRNRDRSYHPSGYQRYRYNEDRDDSDYTESEEEDSDESNSDEDSD